MTANVCALCMHRTAPHNAQFKRTHLNIMHIGQSKRILFGKMNEKKQQIETVPAEIVNETIETCAIFSRKPTMLPIFQFNSI